jgi:hypothetical protein
MAFITREEYEEREKKMSQDLWDEFASSGNYVKFENVGDSVAGTITSIRRHTFDDGKVVPQIEITTDEGEEVTLTAGQIKLKQELTELRPVVGDHLYVVYSKVEKRAGGKTLKHFVVDVNGPHKPGNQWTATKSGPDREVTAYPAVKTAAPPDADPLASLTPEQLAAIKNMSAGGLI